MTPKQRIALERATTAQVRVAIEHAAQRVLDSHGPGKLAPEYRTLPRAEMQLQAAVYEAILAGRVDTKKAARKVDLAALLLLLGHHRDVPDAAVTDYDERRAQRVARRVSTVFGASAVAWLARHRAAEAPIVKGGTRIERPEPDELLAPVLERGKLSAATETTDAITTQQRELEAFAPDVLTWEWNAVLDSKTCPYCAGRDGEKSVLGRFVDGPPPAHPRCRCWLELVTGTKGLA